MASPGTMLQAKIGRPGVYLQRDAGQKGIETKDNDSVVAYSM
jgi:hypothetical protein